MCISTRTHLTYNNDKPWFTAKLRQLRQAKEDAYRKGDKVLYKQVKYTLEKEIRVAKRNYSEMKRTQFSSSDSASVWKGLKEITNYKTPSPSTVENQQLADDLNEFYCRFEKTPHTRSEHLSTQPFTPPLHFNNCLVQLSYQIWPQKTTEGSPDCTDPEWAKGLAKSLWTPHIQHTPSLNCYRLVDATELWAPERPDTGTVSSPKQSISWTLDINCGTHTIYTLIYLTHILSLHFNLHIIYLYIQLSIVIYLYIVNLYIFIPYSLVLFFNSSFYYLCFLFCHCHSVALWKLLSRKQIPRLCKHTWQ